MRCYGISNSEELYSSPSLPLPPPCSPLLFPQHSLTYSVSLSHVIIIFATSIAPYPSCPNLLISRRPRVFCRLSHSFPGLTPNEHLCHLQSHLFGQLPFWYRFSAIVPFLFLVPSTLFHMHLHPHFNPDLHRTPATRHG